MILQSQKIIIIGGGILGLSIARKFLLEGFKNITVLEKENDIACHQSLRNSGVMHAGLYYAPDSLKANLSRKGILLMKAYCKENSVAWEECGKIVVATNNNELDRLNSLLARGKKNNLKDIKMLNAKEVNKIEPYVNAKAGILVPEESIVNFKDVAKKYQEEIDSLGGKIKLSSKVIKINHLNHCEEIVLDNGTIILGKYTLANKSAFAVKVPEVNVKHPEK